MYVILYIKDFYLYDYICGLVIYEGVCEYYGFIYNNILNNEKVKIILWVYYKIVRLFDGMCLVIIYLFLK